MTEEIHITVPKGAKVVIHEEESEPEPPREATLADILKALEELKAIEATRITWYPWYTVPYQPPPTYPIHWSVTNTNGTTSEVRQYPNDHGYLHA